MDLQLTCHYTHFVYPFLVKEKDYRPFLKKLLTWQDDKGHRWHMNMYNEAFDLNTVSYFLPYVKKFLFPTLYWNTEKRRRFDQMSTAKKLDVLEKMSSLNFELQMQHHKGNNYACARSGLAFDIANIQLFCFEQGVCFIVFKTELANPGGLTSGDVLDFNYKFRTINPRYQKKKKMEGLFTNSQDFTNIEDFSKFLEELLDGFEDLGKENIYFDRLFTYSYMCLDQKEWNDHRELSEIINEFYKFLFVLPRDYGSTFDPELRARKDNTYSRWKYSLYGFSRESGVVLSSEVEQFNATKLPEHFESIYFYIFLLAFYQRITLILFSEELLGSDANQVEKLKSRFTRFTHFSWFSQIANSEHGMDLWKKWQQAFDLPELFDEVQKEYTEFYEYTVAKGQEGINWLLIIIYLISVVFSGGTLLASYQIIDSHSPIFRWTVEISTAATILLYPAYLISRNLWRWIQRKSDIQF